MYNHRWICGQSTSAKDGTLQEKFRHYKDLWRLDLTKYTWEQLPAKKGPCARSGHRMVVHKNRLLLFGGFTDDDKKQA